MVRTSSAGIKISSGKSSKKGGGGGSGSSSSTTSTRKSSSKGSNRLPPIPHTETPSWQKPITNFFNLNNADTTDAKTKNTPKEGAEAIDDVVSRDNTKEVNVEKKKTLGINLGDPGENIKDNLDRVEAIDNACTNYIKEINDNQDKTENPLSTSDENQTQKSHIETETFVDKTTSDQPQVKRRKLEDDKENEIVGRQSN